MVHACVNGAGSFQTAWHFPMSRGHSGNSRGSTPSPSHPGDHPDTRALCWSRAVQALVSRGPTTASCSPGPHGGQSCLWPPEPSSSDRASPAKFGNSSGSSCVGWWSLYSVSCLVPPPFPTQSRIPSRPTVPRTPEAWRVFCSGQEVWLLPAPPGMAPGALPRQLRAPAPSRDMRGRG